MRFHNCLTILLCLILGISGCMKAAKQKPAPPPALVEAPPQIELKGPYDSEIPAQYLDRLNRIHAAADEAAPLTFLIVADHFAVRGELEKALHFLDRAADGFILGNNRSGEATAWTRKVTLLFDFNREKEALRLIGEATGKWKAPPLTAFPAYVEGHRALLRGNFPLALSRMNQALQDNAAPQADDYLRMLRRDTELDAGIAGILSDRIPRLLSIYGVKGTPATRKEAVGETNLRNALALNQQLRQTKLERLLPAADFGRSEADARNFLGLDAWMKGNRAEALRHLAAARDWSRNAGFQAAEIRSLLFQSELGLQMQDRIDGRQTAERLREQADHYRAPRYRIWARLLLARYEKREGRKREAIGFLQEAAAIIESQRAAPNADMLDEICRVQRRAAYEALVDLFTEEGMVREAMAAAGKAKSLMMVDLLAGEELGRSPAEREWARQEVEIGGEIREIQRRIMQVSDETTGSLLEGLKKAEAAYRDLLERIGGEERNLHNLLAVRGVDPLALQLLLDDNTTLFDYFATPDCLYVWAINRERIHQERIDLSREEMRSLVFSFLAAIRDRNKRKMESIARNAYDLLLKPVIPFVSGERIGFIPDDALVYLPFAAMSYRGKFLAEGFAIFQLPEAGLFDRAITENGADGLRILAFGDPDLDNEALNINHASRELEQIRKRRDGATVLIGPEASEAKAGEMPAGYDIIHFAVRGQFFPEDTMNSGLLLTPGAGRDGRLTIREIFGLRFRGRGIVLSGCDPLPEHDPEGKGLLALQRAFLNTGSQAVISTLWLSDDKAEAHFIERLYRQLERKGSFADALRAAQLHLIREGHPPHVWAAFALTGGN